MQTVSNLLVKNGLLFSRLEQIPIKSLGSRKRVECFFGVTPSKEFGVVFTNCSKSRILIKELDILEDLVQKLENIQGCRIKKRIFFALAPICSKALNEFKKKGWKVLHVSM